MSRWAPCRLTSTVVVGVAALTAWTPLSCCPGFFPLLPENERSKSYDEPTPVSRDEGRERLSSWLNDPSNASGASSLSSGTGQFHGVTESPTTGQVSARYMGFCASPPADPSDDPWRLQFQLEASFDDRRVKLDFTQVVLMWPMLGDNPSALTHGNKRAPRKKQDMVDITKNCLDPLKERILKEISTPPPP